MNATSCSLLRPWLFRLEPETAHHLSLAALRHAHACGVVRAARLPPSPRRVMGLDFPNAVGLAAGLDKNGEYVDGLAALGFGFLEIVARAHYRGILGINIGKNADTPVERAADDYLIGLRKVYSAASYVAVNISSPNTPNLRSLQQLAALSFLLARLKAEQRTLAGQHGKYVPLEVKIAPDLSAV